MSLPYQRSLFCARSAPENASRTTGGGFRYRISLLYQRSLFCAPSAPENASRTREGGFRYRISLPYQRSLFFTPGAPENAPRTTGGPFRYRMPQTRRSHILRRRLPRHQHHHYGHPTHGSRLGQETTALRKNLCNFFKKLRELSRSFFIFVPNKYRNTQCKLFTTNTTNSWNLPL